jgi:hypothetical protein
MKGFVGLSQHIEGGMFALFLFWAWKREKVIGSSLLNRDSSHLSYTLETFEMTNLKARMMRSIFA